MKPYHLVIVGAGFAGLWAALGAARARKLFEKDSSLDITVLNKTAYHGIRVRYYEEDLEATQFPLEQLLSPVNVNYTITEVTAIDDKTHQVITESGTYSYDSLILAAGSQLPSMNIPGLQEYGFNVDTYAAAKALQHHLESLPQQQQTQPGLYTMIVVGGGFTGLEVITELSSRMKNIVKDQQKIKLILIDRSQVASTLGAKPQARILQALEEMNIQCLSHTSIEQITEKGVYLSDSGFIPASTVIWTVGMEASPLTCFARGQKDEKGRIYVNQFLQIPDAENCFAVGDVACAKVDEHHDSVMSCQHGRPQGRIGGYNAVAQLFHQEMIAYHQEDYVTVLDLGEWGALYMEGWDRKIVREKSSAKRTKREINHHRICPPTSCEAKDLLNAAKPELQVLPNKY